MLNCSVSRAQKQKSGVATLASAVYLGRKLTLTLVVSELRLDH